MFSSAVFANSQTLLFCYEDKDVAPMFLGVGQEVPIDQPGASIEVLRKLDAELDGVNVAFVRKPWRRCLNDLEFNKVDAVIASYRPGRERIAAYPFNEKGELQTQFAVSRFSSCLIGSFNFIKSGALAKFFKIKHLLLLYLMAMALIAP
ncbi:hypothetical protein [Pseudoalteromonas sp. MMG006]|uniref:hypothetical protein n=1 Tax=Pseudoalteromonas sp. MMG006 TaxID=2822683 RepID=UPI001FFC55F3|nr:hypothetical protein [Pseudoalteromonas sp. MMG006]